MESRAIAGFSDSACYQEGLVRLASFENGAVKQNDMFLVLADWLECSLSLVISSSGERVAIIGVCDCPFAGTKPKCT